MKVKGLIKATISVANNLVQHDRTKHIGINRHFIKEKPTGGQLCIPFVQSRRQLAYIFTKGLQSKDFLTMIPKMGMKDTHTRGGVLDSRVNTWYSCKYVAIIEKGLTWWCKAINGRSYSINQGRQKGRQQSI